MKTTFITGLSAAALLFGGAALAEECTQDAITAKVTELSTEMQKLAASDPEKMQELVAKMQEGAVKFQAGGTAEEACAFYDDLLADVKS